MNKNNLTEFFSNFPPLLTQIQLSGQLAIWYWDEENQKIIFSPAYYLLLGYPPYEAQEGNAGLIDYIHPNDKTTIENKVKTTISQKHPNISFVFKVTGKSGKIHLMECKGKRISLHVCEKENAHQDQKEILMGGVMDLTDSHTTKNALLESERKRLTLMNNIPGMAYRNRYENGAWKPESVSKGIEKLLGETPENYIASKSDMQTSQVIFPDDRDRVRATVQIAIKNQTPFELIYRVKGAFGKLKWVWEKGEIIFDSFGTPFAMEGFIMDITAFKNEEKRLYEFLESANKERYRFGELIGKSQEMQQIYDMITKAADGDANVIIYGESGTGKELVAKAIHQSSKRKDFPLISVNCGAISEKLLESEFFGYKKGAFTGAREDKKGFFAAAEGGTLFLDELGEISSFFQIKLLRVLDGYGYTPVGGNTVQKTNVRVIAATNRNLTELIKKGEMREDFFYRIHIVPITLPPLRNRKGDIPLLIDHFLEKHRKERDGNPKAIPGKFMDALQAYHWPGNIRELENIVQRYLTLGDVDPIPGVDSEGAANPESHPNDPTHLNELIQSPSIPLRTKKHPSELLSSDGLKAEIEAYEKELIQNILTHYQWHRGKTAQALRITPRTLYRKMIHYKL